MEWSIRLLACEGPRRFPHRIRRVKAEFRGNVNRSRRRLQHINFAREEGFLSLHCPPHSCKISFMSDKQLALESIQRLPEDASLDAIAERLEFLAAIRKGLNQIERGETVSHEEVKRQLAAWLTK
jgi:hypothetical protein